MFRYKRIRVGYTLKIGYYRQKKDRDERDLYQVLQSLENDCLEKEYDI